MASPADTGQTPEFITTTREFIASVYDWQYAVATASAAPHPTFLASWVDLARAAVDPGVAQEWAEFLGKVERGTSELIAEAVERGHGDTTAVTNARSLLSRVTSAHRHAMAHARALASSR